jgi:hypothetical protein
MANFDHAIDLDADHVKARWARIMLWAPARSKLPRPSPARDPAASFRTVRRSVRDGTPPRLPRVGRATCRMTCIAGRPPLVNVPRCACPLPMPPHRTSVS